jgi:hypothetical protein
MNANFVLGVLLLLLRIHGIIIINGRPCHSQSQGLVEQCNHVIKDKLRAWKESHYLTSWRNGLLEVALAMNSQVHSATSSSPFKVLFWQPIVTDDWATAEERRTIPVMNEDGRLYMDADALIASGNASHTTSPALPAFPQIDVHVETASKHSDASNDHFFQRIIDMGDLSFSDGKLLITFI